MTSLHFDANSVAPDMGFEVLPAGWYQAMIDDSEMRPTKDETGAYLQLRFSVISGHFAGKKVFTRLNLKNANPVAQEIAYKQLSSICHAINVLQVTDSTQLHGHPMHVKLKVRKDKSGEYDDQNEIIAYKSINEVVELVQHVHQTPNAGFGAPAMPFGFGVGATAPQTEVAPQTVGHSVGFQQAVQPQSAVAAVPPVTQQAVAAVPPVTQAVTQPVTQPVSPVTQPVTQAATGQTTPENERPVMPWVLAQQAAGVNN